MAFKITNLAKDLGMKSKEITEFLTARGVECKTTQKTLDPKEFDLVFEHLTRGAQVSNIDDYLFGDTYIPSAAPAAKKESKKAKAEPAKEAPAAEAAPEVQAKAEKKESAPEKVEAPKKPAAKLGGIKNFCISFSFTRIHLHNNSRHEITPTSTNNVQGVKSPIILKRGDATTIFSNCKFFIRFKPTKNKFPRNF